MGMASYSLIKAGGHVTNYAQPESRAFDRQSAPLGFLAAVLFVIGISDLVSVSLPEEISQYHWGSQGPPLPSLSSPPIQSTSSCEKSTAPVRLILFFCITFYSYFLSDSSPLYASKTYSASTWGEGLKNRVLFTWAFVEMITWFWVFVTLREERRDKAIKMAEKRAAEENMM